MPLQYQLFMFFAPLAVCVSLGVISYTRRYRTTPGARALAWQMTAVLGWLVFNMLELADPTEAGTILWARLQYPFFTLAPVAWLGFALAYTGRNKTLTPRRILLLGIVPCISSALALTNDWHHLIWESYTFVPVGNWLAMSVVSYGPWFWVHILYTYTLIFSGAALIMQDYFRAWQLYRQQSAWAILGALAPILFNLIYILHLIPGFTKDYSSVSYAMAGLAFAIAIFRYRLFDIRPVARDLLIEHMDDGMLVLDEQDRVVDLNAVASQRIFGLPPSRLIGQTAARGLPHWTQLVDQVRDLNQTHAKIILGEGKQQRHYDLAISPLIDRMDHLTGRLIVWHDITDLAHAEQAMAKARQELEDRVRERTADLAHVNAQLKQEIEERRSAEVEASRRAKMLEAIAEVGHLVTAGGDLQTTLDTLAHKIADLTHFDGAGIGLYDAEKQELTFRAYAVIPALGLAGEKRTRLVTRLADSPALQQMVREKQPILFDDPLNDPRIRGIIKQVAHEGGLKYSATFPLLSGEEFIGRLDLWAIEPRRLSPEDLNFYSALAYQTATVVQSARLFLTLERRIADRTRELTTLYKVSATASRALNLDTLLSESLSDTLTAVGGDSGAIYLLDDVLNDASNESPSRLLRLAVHQGDSPAPLTRNDTLPTDRGLGNWVIAHSLPATIPDVTTDVRTAHLLPHFGAGTLSAVPLLADGQVLGLLTVGRSSGQVLDIEEIASLSSIAAQVGIAVGSHRLRQNAIVLEERQRIARDLHDSITQSLYGLVTLSEAGRVQLQGQAFDAIGHTLSLVGQTTRQVLKEMRLFIFQLNPPVLEQEGLVSALHQRLDSVEGRANVKARLLADDLIHLALPVEAALYQIAQEALNNVLRHAHANSVTVHLHRAGPRVILEIMDDGDGFDPQTVSHAGMGLRNMQQRAAEIGGTLEIDSRPGKGTCVQVSLPGEE